MKVGDQIILAAKKQAEGEAGDKDEEQKAGSDEDED